MFERISSNEVVVASITGDACLRLFGTLSAGKKIWRSLGTDSPTVAKRRALRVAAQIEHEFELPAQRLA